MHSPSGTLARHRAERLRFYFAQTDHNFSSSIVLLIEHRNDVQILKPRVASLKQYVLKILTSFLSIEYGQRSLESSSAKHEGTGQSSIVRDDKTTSLPIIKAKTKLFTGFLNNYKWNLLTNCAVWIKILG